MKTLDGKKETKGKEQGSKNYKNTSKESLQDLSKATSEAIKVVFGPRVVLSSEDYSAEMIEKLSSSGFGTLNTRSSLSLSDIEAAYLHEKGEIVLTDARSKALSIEKVEARAQKKDKNFWIRYAVYSDLRKRGYLVKTALKYGADFRVYDRGVKVGEDHSKWIVHPVSERKTYSWHEFSAQNRIAHNTKKRLMLAIVDDEGEVLYYEVRWVRP